MHKQVRDTGEVVPVKQPLPLPTGVQDTAVGPQTISEMPVTSFLSVVETIPGVVRYGNQLHIQGGRGDQINYMVDGVRITDPVTGTFGGSLEEQQSKEKFSVYDTSIEVQETFPELINNLPKDYQTISMLEYEQRHHKFLYLTISEFPDSVDEESFEYLILSSIYGSLVRFMEYNHFRRLNIEMVFKDGELIYFTVKKRQISEDKIKRLELLFRTIVYPLNINGEINLKLKWM